MPQAAPPELPPLPAYRHHGVAVYLNPDEDDAPRPEDIFGLPEALRQLPGTSTRQPGTPTCWQWHPAWHRGPGLVVRRYAHGGLLGRLWGTLFAGPGRMLREFRTAILAARRGVPTPVPVALRIERAWGPLVRGHLVTRRIPGALDLLELCRSAGAQRTDAAWRRRVGAAVAATIADMHDAGIVHADLNLKNLLVRDAFDEPEAFVIDFDRARLAGRLGLGERMRNLLRLDRSVLKWAASRRAVSPLDRLRVLCIYLDRYPRWRERWGEIARRYARAHLLHRLSRQDG